MITEKELNDLGELLSDYNDDYCDNSLPEELLTPVQRVFPTVSGVYVIGGVSGTKTWARFEVDRGWFVGSKLFKKALLSQQMSYMKYLSWRGLKAPFSAWQSTHPSKEGLYLFASENTRVIMFAYFKMDEKHQIPTWYARSRSAKQALENFEHNLWSIGGRNWYRGIERDGKIEPLDPLEWYDVTLSRSL